MEQDGHLQGLIDTDKFSALMRDRAIDLGRRKLLITRFTGSLQESDLTEPANCGGLGRIRHFRRSTTSGWPPNPLPIDPASRALGLPSAEMIVAQAFQNAVCNWRCWYCFVDFELLNGDRERSAWVSADELLDSYLSEATRAPMLDLTGGQPDLTPEWIPWMMDAIERRGLASKIYLWSDDNLSNDYFWRYLDDATRARLVAYPMYGRACCFKGYNEQSFSFNTRADPRLFRRQFDLARRLIDVGMDLYAYVTFTTPRVDDLAADMRRFMDLLQNVDANMPLRTVPLEVRPFAPVNSRMDTEKLRAIDLQVLVVSSWLDELATRFSSPERAIPISLVPLGA